MQNENFSRTSCLGFHQTRYFWHELLQFCRQWFYPILEEDGVSVGAILDMMNGKYPIVPNWDMGVVDVRDVASLELLVMTKPEAAGKRFVCSAENMFMKDQMNTSRTFSRICCQNSKESGAKLATKISSSFLACFEDDC